MHVRRTMNKQRLTASATIFSPSNHDGTASNVTSKLFVEKTRSQFLLSTMSSSEKKKKKKKTRTFTQTFGKEVFQHADSAPDRNRKPRM